MNKTLEELRKEIDVIDEELLQVLAKRMHIVREIGKLKKEHNITPLDEDRWQEVLHQIIETAKKHNLPETSIKKIYELIHDTALSIEKEL